ncbi:hypothetical protein STRDD13_00316 [Streptococcus sp. DD13]|nr:hypothetical protein STRDD13_00316 [Streptococcus sp. DD13]
MDGLFLLCKRLFLDYNIDVTKFKGDFLGWLFEDSQPI